MKNTKKITTCALMLALSVVLTLMSKPIPFPQPQGGSVTLASMAPIIILSMISDTKWGICTSVAFSLIQLITGFYPPPTKTILSFFAVIMLDYILAFGVIGLAGVFHRRLGLSTALSGAVVMLLRYICHILSGILIWGVYAESGQNILIYSLIYNGTYMIPEIIITTTALALISRLKIFRGIG